MAFAAVFVISLQPDLVGLECYVCKKCEKVPDKPDKCHASADKFCAKFVGTKDGEDTIERGCVSEGEENGVNDNFENDKYGFKGKLYTCSTDKCNSSGNLRGWSILIQLLFVSALLVFTASVFGVVGGHQ